MKITRIGIDLAKQVFQLHGVDVYGQPVLRRQLKRKEMVDFFEALSPCDIGMEACASSHHCARTLEATGHRVKLMALQFVKPYVKRKNPLFMIAVGMLQRQRHRYVVPHSCD